MSSPHLTSLPVDAEASIAVFQLIDTPACISSLMPAACPVAWEHLSRSSITCTGIKSTLETHGLCPCSADVAHQQLQLHCAAVWSYVLLEASVCVCVRLGRECHGRPVLHEDNAQGPLFAQTLLNWPVLRIIACKYCNASLAQVWDLREGQLFYTLYGHEGAISEVAFSPAGDFFASAGADEQVP